ncbi:MAG: phospho-sugar mutase, partial [Clostridia bacterium]
MLFAEMVCYYTDQNISIFDKLQQLFEQYGYFVESSVSIAFKGLDGMQKMSDIMNSFHNQNLQSIAGVEVVAKIDLEKGVTTWSNGNVTPCNLPTTNVVKYDLGNDEWLCVRPSGTEPKLKIYVSTCEKTKQLSMDKNKKLQDAIKAMI